jgi:hypothetical protein
MEQPYYFVSGGEKQPESFSEQRALNVHSTFDSPLRARNGKLHVHCFFTNEPDLLDRIAFFLLILLLGDRSCGIQYHMATAADYVLQAGVIAVRSGKICLVTSSNGKRWVIPKGVIEPGQTAGETALQIGRAHV